MATLYASVDAIRVEARRLDPVRVLLTVLMLPFVVLGFAARLCWQAFALAWTGAVFGWRQASARVPAAASPARGPGS